MCNSSGMPRTVQNDKAEEGGCKCNQEDFLNDVAARIPSRWHIFGAGLGIDNETLKGVAVLNYSEQPSYFAEVYSIWKRENRKAVTWEVVIGVLESNLLQERALACELRKKHRIV